ncbi:MAG: AAA family ATPase [Pseudomonadaceae bacterium]|nr:AAA family ATPase [Pseudomonadaceae bacterium]
MTETTTSNTPPANLPSHQGTRWTQEEDTRLAQGFREVQGTIPARVEALAREHGRSSGAVLSRLRLLDLIDYGPLTPYINGKPAPEAEAPAKQGEHFTEDEVAALLVAFQTGRDLHDLAAEMGRSAKSLALKLVAAGIVTPGVNTNPQPPLIKYPKAKPAPKRVEPPTTSATTRITVTPEFQTALATIEDGGNLLILGSAGTGKSTFLKWLRKKLANKKKYAVLAPTGMAALNVGGQTIHSFFGFKPQLLVGTPLPKPRNPKLFANLDVLVIDEISMVRADVFDSIDKFLRKYGKSGKEPFGGVQLVLMGDLCQLPPVVRREESDIFATTYPTPFFFSTPAWELGAFATIRFTHIFRQTDAPFITLLNAVRNGQSDASTLTRLNARVEEAPPKGAVILAARNNTVDAINQRELAKLATPARTYAAETSGDLSGKEFTTPAELTLKVGARVMFTRNHKLGLWVNGTLGTVTKLESDLIEVETADSLHHVEREKWESVRYKHDDATNAPVATVAGTFVQFPLTLAWALTIHKAQGQTIPKCVIDLADGGTFAEGQLYVALSRARSLESLSLTTPIQPRHIKTHPAVLAFYQQLDAAT